MVSLVHGSEEVGAIFRNLIETGFFDGLFPDKKQSTDTGGQNQSTDTGGQNQSTDTGGQNQSTDTGGQNQSTDNGDNDQSTKTGDENKSTQKAENCKEVKTKGLCSTGPEGWHYVNDECTKYDGCDMMMEDSGKLYESENDCMMECSEKEAEEM